MRETSQWLVLLVQLPGSPSSARVTVWRRLRAAGAVSLQNAVWVLPDAAAQRRVFHQVQEMVREHGGSALILRGSPLAGDADAEIVARFRAERARDYGEFGEQCGALLSEVDREASSEKLTFAELEEIEQDFEKLTSWLDKIRARDFFPDERAQAATEALERCRGALAGFARAVYEAEGLEGPSPGGAVADGAARAAGTAHGGAADESGESTGREPAGRVDDARVGDIGRAGDGGVRGADTRGDDIFESGRSLSRREAAVELHRVASRLESDGELSVCENGGTVVVPDDVRRDVELKRSAGDGTRYTLEIALHWADAPTARRGSGDAETRSVGTEAGPA